MQLHYKNSGKGRSLVILRALFDHSENWSGQIEELSNHFRIIVPDLRNHGRSPRSNDFSYDLMVEDILRIISDLQLKNIVLMGHCMGGKLAVHFAQKHGNLLSKLVIVDMAMKAYENPIQPIIDTLHEADVQNLSSHQDVDNFLNRRIPLPGIVQFLLTNLYQNDEGKLDWRMNFPVMEREMDHILSENSNKEIQLPTLFLRGEKSGYLSDQDLKDMETIFNNLKVVNFPDADHFIYAEKPEEFRTNLVEFGLMEN